MTDCNCEKYIEYISKLQELLDDYGIPYESISKSKDTKKVIFDVMDPLDLSSENIEELVESYNETMFLKGTKGLIEFIYNNVIKDDENNIIYICEDPQKKVFKFYNNSGVVKDTRCKLLLDSIGDILLKKVNKLYRISINKIYDEEPEAIESDDSNEEEYNEELEEIIAEELLSDTKIKNLGETSPEVEEKKENDNLNIDDKVNNVVSIFLEIKKSLTTMRKPIIDELVKLLTL